MTPQDGQTRTGDVCAEPACDRVLLYESSFCSIHEPCITPNSPTSAYQSTKVKAKKILSGHETRFVAKKSDSPLRGGVSSRPPASDPARAPKFSDSRSRGIRTLDSEGTARKSVANRSVWRSLSSATSRQNITRTTRKTGDVPSECQTDTTSAGTSVVRKQVEGSDKGPAAGDNCSSPKGVHAASRDWATISQDEGALKHQGFKAREKFAQGAEEQTNLEGSSLTRPLNGSEVPTMDNVEKTHDADFDELSRQREHSIELLSSPQAVSRQSLSHGDPIKQQPQDDTEKVDATARTRLFPAVPPCQGLPKHSGLNRARAVENGNDAVWASVKRSFSAMNQDGWYQPHGHSALPKLPEVESRIDIVIQQRAVIESTPSVVLKQGNASARVAHDNDNTFHRAIISSTKMIRPRKNIDLEAQRSSRLAKFNSTFGVGLTATFNPEAFDTIIYSQSKMLPPIGVSLLGSLPSRMMVSGKIRDIGLHVDPLVHNMHRRTEEWYRKKSREIEDRGGRKTWFGKPMERRRWLNAQDAAMDKERDQARKAGRPPPRQDPEPWTYRHVVDFGAMAEKDLPADVLENPGWARMCAYFRESTVRQREYQKNVEETESFYRDLLREHAN